MVGAVWISARLCLFSLQGAVLKRYREMERTATLMSFNPMVNDFTNMRFFLGDAYGRVPAGADAPVAASPALVPGAAAAAGTLAGRTPPLQPGQAVPAAAAPPGSGAGAAMEFSWQYGYGKGMQHAAMWRQRQQQQRERAREARQKQQQQLKSQQESNSRRDAGMLGVQTSGSGGPVSVGGVGEAAALKAAQQQQRVDADLVLGGRHVLRSRPAHGGGDAEPVGTAGGGGDAHGDSGNSGRGR
jgi:hypothetical protein